MEVKEKDTFVAQDEGFTLAELWRIIKANFILILLITGFFVALGFIYTYYVVTPMYKSSVDIYVNVEEDMDTRVEPIIRLVLENIREQAKFKDTINSVLEEKSEQLQINYHWGSVSKRISTSVIGNSTTIKIVYEDANPEVAQSLVVAIADELCRRHELAKGEQGSLKFNDIINISKINAPDIDPHQAPFYPNKKLNIIISFLLGAIIGVVIIILKEQFSSIFQSEEEIERVLSLPVIATIPHLDGSESSFENEVAINEEI